MVVLSRTLRPLAVAVRDALAAQQGVRMRLHRVEGAARPEDPNRWATIARARNRARRLGDAGLVMFVDDDVVLAPDCIRRLADGLAARPSHGAVAADYSGRVASDGRTVPHVTMGATLFRRCVLARIRFRWRPGRCECGCCVDDLRRAGWAIDYLQGARAVHRPELNRPAPGRRAVGWASRAVSAAGRGAANGGHHPPGVAAPRILVALDRRHLGRFRRAFLETLRRSGNAERVHVVGYGLYPSECRALALRPGVTVHPRAANGQLPPLRRLRDFQSLVATFPADAPVAYWDAGDVIFQAPLARLWNAVRRHPDRVLAVREPKSHPENAAIAGWTSTIRDPVARERAFRLLAARPFLNSGFAAGTARAMEGYFRTADRMRRGRALAGTSDWGDQTALNLFCHSYPERWLEAEPGWNYCLHDRADGEVRLDAAGRFVSRARTPIFVVHGNARSMRKLEIIRIRR